MDDFTIRADPAALTSAALEISKTVSRMKAACSEMDSTVQRTSGYWTGDAAELHRTSLKEQIPRMESAIVRFSGQAEKLRQMAGNYDVAIQAAKEAVEELPSDVIL